MNSADGTIQGKRIINKNPIFWLPVTVACFKTAQ